MSDEDLKKEVVKTVHRTLADKQIKIILTVRQWIAVIAALIIPASGAIWTASAMWRDLSSKLDRLEEGQHALDGARADAEKEFARLREETIRSIPDRFTATDYDTFASLMRMSNPPIQIPYLFELRRK